MSLARGIDVLNLSGESCQIWVSREIHFNAHYNPCDKRNRISLTLLVQRFVLKEDSFENNRVTVIWYLNEVPSRRYRSEFEIVRCSAFEVIFRNDNSFGSQGRPNPFLQMASMVLAVKVLRRAICHFHANRLGFGAGKWQFVELGNVAEAKSHNVISIYSEDNVSSSDPESPAREQRECRGRNPKSETYGDSDDQRMDPDEYWTWDPKIQRFYHWDGEDQEMVYCPDEFD